MFDVTKIKEVESKIRIIRDQKVILKCTVGITFKNKDSVCYREEN